ncbi:MAG: hypothetical protein MHM6MM_001694 [Cercozoa sp. M6MM]
MCRFCIYFAPSRPIALAELITRPSHSIIRQSYQCEERLTSHGMPASLNADGFGIGWYVEEKKAAETIDTVSVNAAETTRLAIMEPEVFAKAVRKQDEQSARTPCVFTSTLPAWNNRNLFRLAEKVVSPLFFAHVRAASSTASITESNCHPFNFGAYLFQHNGMVCNFARMKRQILAVLPDQVFDSLSGTTDSEHAFALFLAQLKDCTGLTEGGRLTPLQLFAAVRRVVRYLQKLHRSLSPEPSGSLLNFAVSDGRSLVVTRFADTPDDKAQAASMYFSVGAAFERDRCSFIQHTEYRMTQDARVEDVCIVSSERLTGAPNDWTEVPTNHAIVVTGKHEGTIDWLLMPLPYDGTEDADLSHVGMSPLTEPRIF